MSPLFNEEDGVAVWVEVRIGEEWRRVGGAARVVREKDWERRALRREADSKV